MIFILIKHLSVPAHTSSGIIALPRRLAGVCPVTGLRRALMYSVLNIEYVKTAFLPEPLQTFNPALTGFADRRKHNLRKLFTVAVQLTPFQQAVQLAPVKFFLTHLGPTDKADEAGSLVRREPESVQHLCQQRAGILFIPIRSKGTRRHWLLPAYQRHYSTASCNSLMVVIRETGSDYYAPG